MRNKLTPVCTSLKTVFKKANSFEIGRDGKLSLPLEDIRLKFLQFNNNLTFDEKRLEIKRIQKLIFNQNMVLTYEKR